MRAILAIAVGLLLVGCALPPPPQDPPPMADPVDDAIRMAAVGDSITDADSRDLAGGVPGPRSWVSYAVGPEVEFIGGWAEWGARIARMADAVAEPFDADVLVILAGTNDAGWTPPEEIDAGLRTIAERSGVDEIVLSSVPPLDHASESAQRLNVQLEEIARSNGWTWVDAAAGLRENGGFAAGLSDDGVHPTEAGARVLGEAIGPAVIEAASD